MISTPTTFVIGAGAGVPYGYPTGAELTRIVMGDVRAFDWQGAPVDERIVRAKAAAAGRLEGAVKEARYVETNRQLPVLEALRRALRYATPLSIDALLMQRQEFVEVGKQAIAAALLPFEVNKDWSLFPYSGDWIGHLVRAMYGDGEGAPEEAVRIVTFNYDRLLEHRLTLALSALRGVSVVEAWEAVQKIPMIHVYGSLGEYVPEPVYGKVDWGGSASAAVNAERVNLAAQSIRLIHERGGDDALTPEVETARGFISDSQRVWFLGFGYDATNVERLAVRSDNGFSVIGTAYGMTEAEMIIAKSAVRSSLRVKSGTLLNGRPTYEPISYSAIELVDGDCLRAFREHANRLH